MASASSLAHLKSRRREDYRYLLDYRTRWNDNDMYHHMNNAVYNFLFDSIVNAYLIDECGLHPPTSAEHPLVAHLHTDFFSSISYPAVAELGLRVNKLGRSSVSYEIGLFEKGIDSVRAVGEFVHVWVQRVTGRPAPTGMSDGLREGLEKIYVATDSMTGSTAGSRSSIGHISGDGGRKGRDDRNSKL
ncbi:acyl-CoA thioester hydrolase [Geosmithia morbida]|uniref:Acyl-CoA thioester hydrolase n=1 Tax=Geosmithia morbida TaxID=1094350 RepID=A0A9P4YQW6_9HYPO|nr:acyl-CoA thioester hydrolase [Geosmithia morbida]KAF4121463.1 acyl-CoA thioester hydrolase [Geosmithia morbida]